MAAILVLGAAGATLAVLFRPGVRRAVTYRATITPLASIIGSGFLVVAPLLTHTIGRWAPIGMVGIVSFAVAVGAIIRFNIRHAEPLLQGDRSPPRRVVGLERLATLALALAYVISVAFYLELLGAFALQPFDPSSRQSPKIVATALVSAIGVVGWLRGLHGLELLEEMAVGVKLAIISGLLAGLVWYDFTYLDTVSDGLQIREGLPDGWAIARTLAGMLLVVQGFETSRYLGHAYDRPTRIRTMRLAQVLSGVIYVGFVALVVPLREHFPTSLSETAILDAARIVTPLLVPLLIVAAIASQFSAAVADTAGGGGMLGGHGLGVSAGYVAVSGGALAVIWTTDVFGAIAFASRAFAVYYLLQAMVAMLVAGRVAAGARLVGHRVGIGLVATGLAFVILFGIPAG